MSKLRKILNHVGLLVIEEANSGRTGEEKIKYSVKNKSEDREKLILHRDFLKSIIAEENNRLTLIENKTTQLVAQTGVIFALLSLFIPMIVDKIDTAPLKILFLFTLLLAFLLYLLAIHHAVKNFNVKNFNYMGSSRKNVIDYQDESVNKFLVEEINDLLDSTKTNNEINNAKADNLIYSSNSFRLANILTGILDFLLCLSLSITKPKKDPITIENPIRIENSTLTPN